MLGQMLKKIAENVVINTFKNPKFRSKTISLGGVKPGKIYL